MGPCSTEPWLLKKSSSQWKFFNLSFYDLKSIDMSPESSWNFMKFHFGTFDRDSCVFKKSSDDTTNRNVRHPGGLGKKAKSVYKSISTFTLSSSCCSVENHPNFSRKRKSWKIWKWYTHFSTEPWDWIGGRVDCFFFWFQRATQEFVVILDAFWKLPVLPFSREQGKPPSKGKDLEGLPGCEKIIKKRTPESTNGAPKWWGLEKVTSAWNMASFGIYSFNFWAADLPATKKNILRSWAGKWDTSPKFYKKGDQIWRTWETKITVLTNQPTNQATSNPHWTQALRKLLNLFLPSSLVKLSFRQFSSTSPTANG